MYTNSYNSYDYYGIYSDSEYINIGICGWNRTEVIEESGAVLSFIKEYNEQRFEKPASYSEKKVKEILEAYCSESSEFAEGKPNIIVMNESYSDLSVYGINDLERVTPFWNSLEDECSLRLLE